MATKKLTIKQKKFVYTPELQAEIVKRVMGRSLRKVCTDADMPNRDTIYSWLAKYSEFADQYARACVIRREDRFESMEEIPDIEADVQRARLKVDVLKWQLSKEEPRKYGDKVDLTSDGEKIQPVLVRFIGENDKQDN